MRPTYRFTGLIVIMIVLSSSILISQQAFWKQMNISLNAYIYTVHVTPQGLMFAGTDKGVYYSADTGRSWNARMAGLPAGPGVGHIVSDSKGTVYASVNTPGPRSIIFNGIYRLEARDTVWKASNSGLDSLNVTALGADLKNNIIYAGTSRGGGYRLLNADTTWQHVDTSLSDPHVCCLLADTTNGYVFAGTWSGIFRSSNNGNSWTRLGTSTTFIVMTMAINSKSHLFAGSSNYGVFRSTNSGMNWVAKNPVMMDSLATNIVVNSKDIVYANTQSGIYSSTNNGDSWTALAGNLRRTTYLGLDADQFLYAGTTAGTVYRSVVSTSTGIANTRSLEPVGYCLDNNYPNPFNPSTTIAFNVPHNTRVWLNIYDCLGRHVATVLNGRLLSSYHAERFDASELSSGVYFYQLRAGLYSSVKKMLVVK